MAGLSNLRALIGLHRVPTSLYLWGDNTYGQLGDSKANTYFSWTTITSGDSHSVAIRSDGTLWAWGDNTYGQLGDGLTANRSSPSQVGTSSWLAVAAGSSHTVGVLTIGTLYTWGGNQFGQLGDSTTVSKSAPAIVGALSTWTKVTAGGNQSGAINSTSQLYVWGNNNSGQLAQNYSLIGLSSPVQVRASGNFFNNSIAIPGTTGNYLIGMAGAGNSAFGFGLGDFTVEYWIYETTWAGSTSTVIDFRKAGVNAFSDTFSTGGAPGIYTSSLLLQSTLTVATTTWTHVAYTRLAGTMKIWVGGQLGGSTSTVFDMQAAGYLTIGTNYTNVNPISGSVTNIRVIKGQALFNDTFTPSTSPLTATTVGHTGIGAAGSITGTVSLLTAQNSSAFVDNSTNNFGLAIGAGTVTISTTLTPFTIATDPSWVNVSSGKSHMVALKSDYTLWAWGDNIYGKLGDGSTITRSSAVQIGSSSWTTISAGGTHTAAIRTDNSRIYTWGLNSSGQLGLNTAYSGSYWTQISEGQYHTLAIRSDGALFVWGRNQYGQLGFGDTVTRSSPTQLGSNSWSAVEAGVSHSIAITSDGKLFVWGDNTYGQLGNNPASTNISWSKIAIASSGSHVMALRNDGTLWTWGEGSLGRMGDSTSASKSSPIQVGALNTWIDIGVGDAGAAAISSIDNALWVWGSGTAGVIGDGTATGKSSPSFVGNNFKKVTGGVTTFAAIDYNNNYGYVWGDGGKGVLGNNRTDILASSPVLINSTDTWSSFSINGHILGIKTDGTLWAWGTNTGGELGLGDIIFRSSPVQVGTSSWIAVSAGGSFSAAIRSDGGLFTWGRNSAGQLGHTDVGANGNSTTILRSSPVQIGLSPSGVTGYVSWSAIATGNEHLLAIKYSDNTLWGWGVNSVGQLGNGLVTSRSSPVQIGTSNWSQIQAGTSFSCGLASDGKLYTWGLNNAGALGDGTTANKSNPTQIGTTISSLSSPVQIASDKSWSAIGAGEGHSLAITNLGALWSWGRNDQGQLGDTTKVYKSSPVQITSGTSYVAVYAGGTHSVALKSDYTMYAWGYNVSGQVGDTSVVSRSAPVQIGASSWIQITTGKDHSAAIKFDNTLWTWGLNSKGQLGDSTTVTKSSPVSVAGLWLEVEAGASHTAAIADNSTLFVFGDDRYGQ